MKIRRIIGAALAAAMLLREDRELAVISTEERCVVFHTAALNPKTTRSTQGVNVMTLKPKYKVKQLLPLEDTSITRPARYRARSLPIAGARLKEDDRGEQQMSLLYRERMTERSRRITNASQTEAPSAAVRSDRAGLCAVLRQL